MDEIPRGQRCVVLELSQVSFCDSAGLNVLLWAWQQAKKTDAALVLTMIGVDTVVWVYETVAEAADERVIGGGA
jgi:anti-sigma B factor antagonist